jgi:hypothetical protein
MIPLSWETGMRGLDERTGRLFCYVDVEAVFRRRIRCA